MVHAATALSTEGQYLQIANQGESNIVSVDDSEHTAIQNRLFGKVSPLYYKARVRLSFSLSEEFKKHFVLIKGLIEFNRSKDFSFEYNLAQRTFETDVDTGQLNDLQVFFENILTWLTQELRFKSALKVVLEFENRYKKAQAEAYAELMELSPNKFL